MNQLYDAHCHLQEPELADMLDQAMARARGAGVVGMMCCGTCESDWERTREIGERYGGVQCSFGLHPWYVHERSDSWLETLRIMLVETGGGVGEIGLDHAVKERRDQVQEEVFLAQLDLARELHRPVSIHCRKAFGRMLELLQARGGLPDGGVLHSWSGAAEMIPQFEKLGLYISFSGSITRPGNRRAQACIRAVSPDRLLIETDAPAIVPTGVDADVNEPSFLPVVAVEVARVVGEKVEWVGERTRGNGGRVFGGGEQSGSRVVG